MAGAPTAEFRPNIKPVADPTYLVDPTTGAPIGLPTSKNNATVAANTASNTVIKATSGYLCTVVVTTTGTAALSLYDNATTNSGTILLTVPANATVGTIYTLNGAASNGITAGGVSNCPGLTVFYA